MMNRLILEQQRLTSYLGLLITTCCALLLSQPAHAAVDNPEPSLCTSDTLGGLFCAFQQSSINQLVMLVMTAAFIGGIFLVFRGGVKLMHIADSQSGHEPLSSALLTLSAGTFLVSFPATVMVGLATFGGDGAWNFRAAAAPGPASAIDGGDFLTMVANFAINAAGPLTTLVMGISVLIGLILIGNSMFNLASMNSPQSRTPGLSGIMGKLVVGIALVNVFWIMEVIGGSFGLPTKNASHFTDIAKNTLGYAEQAKGVAMEERMQFILRIAFASLIPFGLIAFVRGLLIIKDTTDGTKQASIGSGFTHILGGVALVNAEKVSCAITKTLSGTTGMCLPPLSG